jgi:hypothetical protein
VLQVKVEELQCKVEKTKNSELTEVTAKEADYHQFHQVDGGSTLCGKMFDSKMQLA